MVVITGVSGLAGANLTRALLAQGRNVRGLIHKDRRAVEGLAIELVEGDVRDPASLQAAFSGAEAVYHLAAHISLRSDSWDEVEAINVQGTRNVVQACLQSGVRRLIHFSSIHAIEQAPLDQALDETRPRVSALQYPPYDRSKAFGEQEVLQGISRGLEAVILNPTGIIGPYDYYPSHFGQALLSLVEGRILALVAGGFDWVDVRDLVQAAIQAERMAPSGASYILSGHWRSVRQVANMAAALTGRPAPLWTVPMSLAYLAAPIMARLAHFNGTEPIYTRVSLAALHSNRQISHVKASRELGYQPRPFEHTLTDTLDWFIKNGYFNGQSRGKG
ncbi:MAG TPA: NAD-dependent epimerase/dehydratase family protein [Anaerolineales bacterium]|nr:NAD-dependent epimerase/dehydratase family protein [Anaerolineales bacterium]